MSAPGPKLQHSQHTRRLLVILALASWSLPFWCYGLRIGASAAADTALPILFGIGLLSLIMRLTQHRNPVDFAIFFPVRVDQRGTSRSIQINAVLLMAFNLGATWFLLRTAFSHTTMVILLALVTVSAMNLADECWIARRIRPATST